MEEGILKFLHSYGSIEDLILSIKNMLGNIIQQLSLGNISALIYFRDENVEVGGHMRFNL